MAQTEYVVLRQSLDRRSTGLWAQDPRIYKATSAQKAIRLAAEVGVEDPLADHPDTKFAAVPLRSWSPIEIGWENTRRIVVRKSDLTDPKVEAVPAAA